MSTLSTPQTPALHPQTRQTLNDTDSPRFDIEFSLELGTTYNSYLICGTTGTALVDASHEKFHGPYLAALQKVRGAFGVRRFLGFVGFGWAFRGGAHQRRCRSARFFPPLLSPQR